MSKAKMILVVDDDPNLLMFFKEYFKQEGFSSAVIEDPEKAIRTANLVHPDLLIVDIKMPKMDGFQLLARIRESSPEVKTIIVSAYVDGANEEKLKAAKVQAVLKKPVEFTELEKWILKILDVSKKDIQDKLPPGGRPEIRILYVEDETDITDVLTENLPDYGFKIDVAHSAEDGLEKAKKNDYDIIISDHSMRVMSGLEMIQKIINWSSYRKPYVFGACSGNLSEELREQYRVGGVNHFLNKPVKLEELIEWLEALVPEVMKKKQAKKASAG